MKDIGLFVFRETKIVYVVTLDVEVKRRPLHNGLMFRKPLENKGKINFKKVEKRC